VLVFKLGGTATLPAPVAADTIPPATRPTGDAAQLATGEALYHERCSNCHGGAGVGAGVLPDLRHSLLARQDTLHDVVREGALAANGMPNFSKVLTADDVKASQQYILQQGWLEQNRPK
jgi:quinohemoprotein ethanol dehydrogenase